MNVGRLQHRIVQLLRGNWRLLIIAFVLYALPIFIFVQIADEIIEREPIGFDVFLLESVRHLQSSLLDTIIPVVTDIGGVVGVVVITLITIALLVRRNNVRQALFVAISVGGSALLNLLLKAAFQRDRPQLWERIVTENSFSFPSGHAMGSSAIAFSLIVIFWPTRYRWWVLIGALTYMVFVAFTRLYLGVHYPSDIIAGWSMSLLWAGIVSYVLIWRHTHR